MGYMTWYTGKFTLNKPLEDETYNLLVGLAKTRRMKRDPKKLEEMGLGNAETFGVDGEFYYNPNDFEQFGQTWDDSILDYNTPPGTQPWLWLKWIPTRDRMAIEWNGEPNSYHSELWIKYLVERILHVHFTLLSINFLCISLNFQFIISYKYSLYSSNFTSYIFEVLFCHLMRARNQLLY
ncbi:hypothetical protein [Fictibacillus gelatini]|uniref:hypothetical protein n=1 Tax=Fictibacillus gelatini TaxID=225985 RepID=UPI0004256B7A|nr:hypothetical protein [Fictibacillus gelatini]